MAKIIRYTIRELGQGAYSEATNEIDAARLLREARRASLPQAVLIAHFDNGETSVVREDAGGPLFQLL